MLAKLASHEKIFLGGNSSPEMRTAKIVLESTLQSLGAQILKKFANKTSIIMIYEERKQKRRLTKIIPAKKLVESALGKKPPLNFISVPWSEAIIFVGTVEINVGHLLRKRSGVITSEKNPRYCQIGMSGSYVYNSLIFDLWRIFRGKYGLTGDEKSEYQREYIRVWWIHFIDYFRWMVSMFDCSDLTSEEVLARAADVAHNGGFDVNEDD